MSNLKLMTGGFRKLNVHPMIAIILSTIIFLLLLKFSEYLWNKVLVKVTTIFKPVNSVWEIFGIYFLASFLLGR
tara:strand:- start:935 stop:1156 length:222 start_codon:yes stop_codon:yes gene_type:complete